MASSVNVWNSLRFRHCTVRKIASPTLAGGILSSSSSIVADGPVCRRIRKKELSDRPFSWESRLKSARQMTVVTISRMLR